MKQLINGLLYDTHNATKLISVKKGSDFSCQGYCFFKTPNGRLFKELTYWRCAVDGSTDRLSETNQTEMIDILIKYDVDSETILNLFPETKLILA